MIYQFNITKLKGNNPYNMLYQSSVELSVEFESPPLVLFIAHFTHAEELVLQV